MKQRRGKPSRLQWIMSLVLILAGLLFSLPVFPEVLRRSLPQALFVPGFVVLLVLWRQKEKYDDLPLEEQKELERADRMDERKRMLRERAAWLSWQVETGVLAVGMLSFVVFTKRASLAFFHGVLILWWARMLAFGLFRWLLEKKY